jgi:ribosome biogenesis GTPase
VITKADVADAALARALERRLVGTTVVSTSATTGEGVDTLATLLAPGRTAVLLGPSGAGKSTLANALLGADRFATRDVRESDARGRHTTTARQLVAVPSGGVLIDTPGLRSLGLLGDEGIAAAFADIEELALGCRFNDCTHEHEPKCAVVAAVGDGTLAPQRLESYRKLTSEAAGAPRRGRARGGS